MMEVKRAQEGDRKEENLTRLTEIKMMEEKRWEENVLDRGEKGESGRKKLEIEV